ncbi:MAG: FHA domain-containing protein [Woeseiaceae bacterium]
MSLLAAHINDAGISVLSADRILYREPGFALLEDGHLTTGLEAFQNARVKPRHIHSRFWSDLKTEPLPDRRFQHLSAADLVSRHLEQVWQSVSSSGDRLVVAVPAYMSSANLGLFLGIANELNVPVVGLVDAAVAATRREYKGAVPVHVDLGLHVATLSRLAQTGQAQLDRSAVIEASGMTALYEEWIRVIANAFVKQSRFDPLHTAETEQLLLDRLAGWLAAASSSDKVALDVEYRGISHSAELESLDLISAAAPVYQRIASQLRAVYRAEETPAIQLSDRAARMPGLADMLGARVGGEVFLLEPGATARGLVTRCRDMQRGNGGVTLIRHLPWDQTAVEIRQTETPTAAGQPTHLLFDNTAYTIDGRPLSLGSQPAPGERWIDLQGDMPGVSRRHCSLVQQNSQCVVQDHSRYGTFLNGHKIDGSAVLQVGDLLRVGTPGYELRLIMTEAEDGA